MNTKPILLWKHAKLTNAWTLRIGEIRYIGLIRTDKRGESYWKFKEFKKKPINDNSNNPNSSNQCLNKEELDKAYEQSINKSKPPANN